MKELAVKAYKIRQDVLDIIVSGGGGHIGGDMSSVEIMLTLYNRMNVAGGDGRSDTQAGGERIPGH